MKAAITGHTKGIGLGLYTLLQNKGYACLGFSRSNGYDVTVPDHRKKITEISTDCDLFVNNAYNNFDDSQLEMLKLIYEQWTGKDKIIINISSRVTDFKTLQGELKLYADSKSKLDQFCLGKIKNPTIVNLKPGLTDTERAKIFENQARIAVSDIVKVVDFILDNRSKFIVSGITFGL